MRRLSNRKRPRCEYDSQDNALNANISKKRKLNSMEEIDSVSEQQFDDKWDNFKVNNQQRTRLITSPGTDVVSIFKI